MTTAPIEALGAAAFGLLFLAAGALNAFDRAYSSGAGLLLLGLALLALRARGAALVGLAVAAVLAVVVLRFLAAA